jgi:TolB-like protein/tetratricopeptide (TPR) repeat protein
LHDRLKAEATACARLQHPAIATFFESGEADGGAFIAMEFVAGPTLRARLAGGPLGVEETVAITASLLEGLSHAHAAGVLHRDIKPENVILTSDRSAKLLDFGIASLLLTADADTSPNLGQTVAGTIGYMSPEQIRNHALDARSDLFQVAAVMYEMLAGRPAFPGRSPSERLAAVLTATPPALERPDVDDALSHVLFTALSKDPSARPRSAGAFLAALQHVREGMAAPSLPNSLAIMPLQNEGPDEDDWIGIGIADTLVEDLSRRPDLAIVRRERTAGAMRHAQRTGFESRAAAIGAALGCRWILAGTYRRLGPALRVNVVLIEVSTASVALRETIDGTVEGIFVLQDQMSTAVRNRMTVAEAEGNGRLQPVVTAYEHYARGIRLARGGDRVAMQRAGEHFESAIALEPAYADALVGLAQFHALSYTFANDARTLDASLSYSARAIAADPHLAAAYVWQGYALMRLGREDDAQTAFARARALDPTEIFAYYFAGGPGWTTRVDTTVELAQQGLTIQPTFGPLWWSLGCRFTSIGRYDEAQSCFDRCVRLEGRPGTQPWLGIQAYWAECLRRMGRYDEARTKCLEGLDAVERSDFIFRDSIRVYALVTLGRIAVAQGDNAGARAAFGQAIEHVQGRPRTLAGGTMWVWAHALLALVEHDANAYRLAAERFERRDAFDFSWLNLCDDYETCAILSESARVVGDTAGEADYRARAVAGAPAGFDLALNTARTY